MTGDTYRGPGCGEIEQDLIELSLGTLTGRPRAVALAHLESCRRCSAEVEELSRAADQLLRLAPPAEPPVGFESRLFERLRREGVRPGRQQGRRRATLLGAAALVVAAAGFGAGDAVFGSGGATATHTGDLNGWQSTGQLTAVAGGQRVGSVYTFSGKPAWLLMTVDDGSAGGWVTCRVELTNGRSIDLGYFELTGGYGSWAAPLPVPPAQIAAAQIVGTGSQVVASGTLHGS